MDSSRKSPASQDADAPDAERGGAWITSRTGAGGYRTEIGVFDHTLIADERGDDGNSEGPTPYELLLAAIGACTAMTLRMYADRKQWPLEEAVVRLRNARKHAVDCTNCETEPVGIRRIEREIELRGTLTDEQRQRLLLIADRCPVKQTLERGIRIVPATPPKHQPSRTA
jgi:putative redox protein